LHLNSGLVHFPNANFAIVIQAIHGVGLPPKSTDFSEGRGDFPVPIMLLNGDYPWFAWGLHGSFLISEDYGAAVRWQYSGVSKFGVLFHQCGLSEPGDDLGAVALLGQDGNVKHDRSGIATMIFGQPIDDLEHG
jgi:hypothetical protein